MVPFCWRLFPSHAGGTAVPKVLHKKGGKSHHKDVLDHGPTLLLQALLRSQRPHRATLVKFSTCLRPGAPVKWLVFSQHSAFPGPCSHTLLNLHAGFSSLSAFSATAAKQQLENFLYLYFKTCLLFCALLGLRTRGWYCFKYLSPA